MFDKKGMPLKSGIASTNLFVLLDNKPEIRQKKMRFFTLGDYLIYYLTGKVPVMYFMHPTNAAASGLYNLEEKCWYGELISKLGFDSIQFPEIGENDIVELENNGCNYYFCEAIGDQQAALLGSGLLSSGQISYNLGTGSQVSILNDELTFDRKYQTRPFFMVCI